MRAVLALTILAMASCSSTGTANVASTQPAAATTTTSAETTAAPVVTIGPPPGDLYSPPDPLPAGSPGDVIWAEEMAGPSETQALRVLYLSAVRDGTPAAVSGWVAVSPAAGAHRLLVIAHGTVGMADDCAPTINGGATPYQFESYLSAGWTVAFTDYQGLGTPGTHHYLVGGSEARSILDAARAARNIDPAAGAAVDLYGFSQGAHAALWAAELAPELAPELSIEHVVTAAPAILLREWFDEAPPAQAGYLAMIAAGYSAAYASPIDAWLTADAVDLLPEILDGCLLDIQQLVAARALSEPFASAEIGTVAGDLLAANEPATRRLDTRVLLVTGGRDDLFTSNERDVLTDRMCAAGTNLASIHYPEATHVQLQSAARADALGWMQGRNLQIAC